MNNLDQLFEKKLADHTLPPSVSVWEGIEARLSKKNKPLIWIRWAAVFLLGGLILSVIWMRNHEPQPALAIENVQAPVVAQELKEEPNPVEQNKVTGKTEKKNRRTYKHQQVLQTMAANPISDETKNDIVEPIAIAANQNAQPVEIAKPAETTRSIVLVYILDPVSVPDTEHATEEMIVADKKDNSLKKVMKLVGEVKNSESPLGGIREMKEDLFAFDLRKKTTNKKH